MFYLDNIRENKLNKLKKEGKIRNFINVENYGRLVVIKKDGEQLFFNGSVKLDKFMEEVLKSG